jgi:membrane protease subunit HflK
MRDRLYIDAMQQIYSNTTKVLVDTKQGSNLLYLPLDKIMQQTGQMSGTAQATDAAAQANTANNSTSPAAQAADTRVRDGRARERDGR